MHYGAFFSLHPNQEKEEENVRFREACFAEQRAEFWTHASYREFSRWPDCVRLLFRVSLST